MSTEGIDVVEIDMNLPGTHYYLYWTPPAMDGPAAPSALQAARGCARSLDWRVFASGADGETLRLLFATSTRNLDRGLVALAGNARLHGLYLVQAETALPVVARRIHQGRDPLARQPGEKGGPDIHYGLFIGERPWARKMLDLMTRCARDPGPHDPACLSEVAGRFTSRREAITEAYRTGRFSLKDIAEHFDMHFSEVSAIINSASA